LALNLRPIIRLQNVRSEKDRFAKATYLTSKIVRFGFAAAWFFAASPTNRSSSVKATYEGVIR
jgi:hypothetical protein